MATHAPLLNMKASMLLIIQKQRVHYYLCPLVLRWDKFQVKAVVAVARKVNWRLWPLLFDVSLHSTQN